MEIGHGCIFLPLCSGGCTNCVASYRICMTNEIRQRLVSVPFLPFVVHTADGKEYPVPSPDHAHVSPSGNRVSIWTDNDLEFILPALLISGLKVEADKQGEPE